MSSPSSSTSTGSSRRAQKRVLLFGDPVDEVFSPSLQRAGFTAASLDVVYEPQRVSAGELSGAIAGVRNDAAIIGASLAMPFTRSATALLDGLGPEAQAAGAVNTISHRAGALIGWNTDRVGFSRALVEADYDPKGKSVLVLGAGGAARAVVDVLRAAAGRIWVSSRDLEEARVLCRDLEIDSGGATPPGALSLVVRKSDLIVNATPVGMDGTGLPFPSEWLTPTQFVFDLVYNPPLTPLVRGAREQGARAVNGLAMLLYQSIASFEIWTGRAAPEAAMRSALERAVVGHLTR